MEAEFGPVLLHQSFAESEMHRILKNTRYKVRISAGTPLHTCVFPLSSVTFVVESPSDVVTQWLPLSSCSLEPELINRLVKLSSMRQQLFLLVTAPVLGADELQVLSALQQKFLSEDVCCLPVHSGPECVETMLSIAKVTNRSVSSLVHQRLEQAMQRMTSEDGVLSALSIIGLSQHECTVLLDGCGSLENIALANVDQLMDCTSLDQSTARAVHEFFHTTNHT